jgi:tRNA threonylcarbamoyladenosine biosynthesis protein TsaE
MSEPSLLNSVEDTINAGATFAKQLNGNEIIFFHGELGAGKTTFIRGILTALGHTGKVKSPTFTLVEPYQLINQTVYHFDLYRLNNPLELDDIGFRDYLSEQALCLIEWPEKASGYLPKADIDVYLTYAEQRRKLSIDFKN